MSNRFAIDKYSHLDSPIHHWQPQCKLIGLSALIFAFALVEDGRLIPVMLVVSGLFYAISRLPLTFLLSRLRYPGYFLLGVILLLPFQSGETVIWQWGILTLRQEGCWAVALIVSRFLAVFTLGLVLVGTAPFLTTVQAARSLGLPVILTDMLLLSYRYLYQIAVDLATMQNAMQLRGFNLKSSTLPKIEMLHQLAALIGSLLVRSYEQSERVYAAMKLRGYGSKDKKIWTQEDMEHEFSILSLIALCLTLLIAIAFILAEMISVHPS